MTILSFYVDGIIVILTGDDEYEMERLKKTLSTEFEVKDLEWMRYVLGMKVIENGYRICVS